MREFWKSVFRAPASQPEMRRVQYAADYLELFDLFERNDIDVWAVTSDVYRQIREAGIETPADMENGVYPGQLIDALRLAERKGEDRMQAVVELEMKRYDLYVSSEN